MAVQAVKKTAAPAAPEAAPAAQPKKKSKLVPIVVLLVLLGGGGGGAYWYMNREAGPSEAKAVPDKPPVFQVLENFTVNLQIEESPQFLQTAITLKVVDTEAQDAIKARMPEIRNAVLLLLSSKKASEILSVEGKRKLAGEIVLAVNGIFDPSVLKAAPPPPKPAPQEGTAANSPAQGAAQEAPAEPAAETQQSAATSETATRLPVLGVLFTSFIVQ